MALGQAVQRRDAHGIARAIITLAGDRALLGRLSAACRRTINAGYTLERQSEELCRLYWEMRTAARVRALPRARS